MMCSQPFCPGGPNPKIGKWFAKNGKGQHHVFGCGSCLYCRINQSRVKQHRLILEGHTHEKKCFYTATYDERYLPFTERTVVEPINGRQVVVATGEPVATLDPKELQNFVKRVRKAAYPRVVRYFYVGEYGPETKRPHAHFVFFGLGLEDQPLLDRSWRHRGVQKGYTHCGEFNRQSAGYITGYITSKLLSKDRWKFKLEGRHPEFARQSLKPGLGAAYIDSTAYGINKDLIHWDRKYIREFTHGKSAKLPLGRYLAERLNSQIGTDPDQNLSEFNEKTFQNLVEKLPSRAGYVPDLIEDSKARRREQELRFKRFERKRLL